MLEVSSEASVHLAELLAQSKADSAIRVAVMGASSHGSGLGLIVDERTKRDVSIQHGDISFIIERSLLEYCQSIRIGFSTGKKDSCGSTAGFLIIPENPISF